MQSIISIFVESYAEGNNRFEGCCIAMRMTASSRSIVVAMNSRNNVKPGWRKLSVITTSCGVDPDGNEFANNGERKIDITFRKQKCVLSQFPSRAERGFRSTDIIPPTMMLLHCSPSLRLPGVILRPSTLMTQTLSQPSNHQRNA